MFGDILCESPAPILAREAPGLHFTHFTLGEWGNGVGGADPLTCSPTGNTLGSDHENNGQPGFCF